MITSNFVKYFLQPETRSFTFSDGFASKCLYISYVIAKKFHLKSALKNPQNFWLISWLINAWYNQFYK